MRARGAQRLNAGLVRRACCIALGAAALQSRTALAEFVLLDPGSYEQHFVEGFPGPWANGSGVGAVNTSVFGWAEENVPFFDCSDQDLVQAYYFRWKTFHSHMNPTAWLAMGEYVIK
jgi:hypothetical protein